MGRVFVDRHEHVYVRLLTNTWVIGAKDHFMQDAKVQRGKEIPPNEMKDFSCRIDM